MRSKSSICKRCHRLSAVNNARYCARCDAELRAEERPHEEALGSHAGAPVASTQPAPVHQIGLPSVVSK